MPGLSSKPVAFVLIPIIMASVVLGIYFSSTNSGSLPQNKSSNVTLSNSASISATSPTTDASATSVSGGMVSNSSTDIGLKLSASVNEITLQSGHEALNVTFFVQNTLASINNVSKSSNWAIPALGNWSDTLFQCIGWGNLVIFRGFFTLTNISGAQDNALSLIQPGVFYNCSYYDFALYSFQPQSSQAKAYGADPMYSYGTTHLTRSDQVTGYYEANQSYVKLNRFVPPLPFPPGTYTIAAGDEWGQVALLHFAVTGQQSSTSTAVQTIGTTMQSGSAGSIYIYTTTSTYENPVLTSSRTFPYNDIASSFQLGNFTVRMVNNGTGYVAPSRNGTSTVYMGYVFAFNVTTPDRNITNELFFWTPSCSANLGIPCQSGSTWVLPQPENTTINYLLANLLILWYTNTTGLYVSFQEWDEVNITTVVTMFTSSSVASPCVSTLSTETITSVSSVPDTNTNGSATYAIWTTTFNRC